MLKLATVFMGLILVSTSALAAHVTYEGDFSQVVAETECKKFFSTSHYQAKYFRLGPTGYKILVQFLDTQKPASGAFHQVNFTGYLGGSGDVQLAAKLTGEANVVTNVRAQGIVDRDVLYLQFKLDRYEDSPFSTRLLCSATAEFLGD